ncbi:MAG: D-alanyl-D-alanine carboxypeptidase [Flavobacteriales bacterium]|jgi:CubicO group peptidase (beta-lactamase class C family)
MKRIITFLFFVLLLQSAKAQIDPVLAGQLQTVLDNSVSALGNNGVSAYVIMPDGETWNGTSGIGKDNLLITNSTVFHGASITKMNIAILMLLLAEDNVVDLDASWTTYVSLDVDFDPTITVRQLLNHTSGIADYLETASSGNDVISDFNYFYTPEYILENVVSGTPDFQVGTDFNYSNSNYALAALIAENATGNPVQSELRARIWDPLEMEHTYFGAYESYAEATAGVWWNFGNGLTDYSNMPTTSILSYAYGAGNIVSCPTDLGILLRALINGELLNAASQNELLNFTPDSFSSWTAGYGLGIHHASVSDDTVLGHDGYYSNLTDAFHSGNFDFTLVTMSNTQTSWFGLFDPMYEILTDYVVAIDEGPVVSEMEVMVYPNPTRQQFSISSTHIIDEIEVADALGKVFYCSFPKDKTARLLIDEPGCYMLNIHSNQKIITRQLIVSK